MQSSNIVLALCKGSIYFRSIKDQRYLGKLPSTPHEQNPVKAMALTACGAQIALGYKNGDIEIWEIGHFQTNQQPKFTIRYFLQDSATYAPLSNLLHLRYPVASGDLSLVSQSGQVISVSLGLLGADVTLRGKVQLLQADFIADGKRSRLMVLLCGGSAYFHSLPEGYLGELPTMSDAKNSINTAALTKCGTQIALGYNNGDIEIWKIEHLQNKQQLKFTIYHRLQYPMLTATEI